MASQQWDAYRTLKILRRDDVTMTCVGKAISRGNARCRWVLSPETAEEVHTMLQDFESNPPSEAIGMLRTLARLGLCEARHEYQLDNVVAHWRKSLGVVARDWELKNSVRVLREELDKERRERQRLERLFVGDEGFEDGDEEEQEEEEEFSTPRGNGGDYSMGSSTDRALFQALEDAEMNQHDPRDDYSPSVPGSDEIFGSSPRPFSEYEAPSSSILQSERATVTALEARILDLQRQLAGASQRSTQQAPSTVSVKSRRSTRNSEEDSHQARIIFETQMTERLDRAERQRSVLRDQHATLLRDFNSEKEKTADLEKVLEISRQDQLEVVGRLGTLHKLQLDESQKVENLESFFEDSKQTQADLVIELENLRSELADKEQRCEETELERKRTESLIHDLKRELAEMNQKFEEIEVEQTTTEAQLNGTIASCEKEIEHLRTKLEKHSDLSVEHIQLIGELSTRLTSLEVGQSEIHDAIKTQSSSQPPVLLQSSQQEGEIQNVSTSSQTQPQPPPEDITSMLDRISQLEEQQSVTMRSILGRKMKGFVKGAHVSDWASRSRPWKGG